MTYFAAVSVPQSYRADIDVVHCVWCGLGFYSKRCAAEKAALEYMAAQEQTLPPELAGWSSFFVVDTAHPNPAHPPLV